MAPSSLPDFPYHPDPVATGSIEQRSALCRACGRDRGWVSVAPAYAVEDLHGAVCPWCIADGTAAERFDARFTVLGPDVPSTVPRVVLDEVERRTPGFSGWDDERWLFCCEDAAAFLGPVGWEELAERPDAVEDLRVQVTGWGLEADDVEALIGSIDVDGSSTAYLFRCRHCDRHLAYVDLE